MLFQHPDIMYNAGDSQSSKLPLGLFCLSLRPYIRDGCDPDLYAAHIQDSSLMYQAARIRCGRSLGDCL